MKSNLPLLLSALLLLLWISSARHAHAQETVEDPDPLRFGEEIEAFQEWDAKNSAPEDAILFVGSSSIRFWQTAEAFPQFPVINRGFGGSHFSDLIYYYDSLILPYDPSVVVLYEGDNDIASGKSAERVLNDYLQLTARLAEDFPDLKVVFVSIKPSSSRWEAWPEMREANRLIREEINRNPDHFYADLATPLLGEDGRPDGSLFLDDLLHLNELGYEKWNEAIQPLLEELMKE
ncbi:MAG: hypothetical protein GVY02_00950 [Bacteroidetes bacterium]|nr:hypothetical protein [Bacteroidota bacterium]